MSRITSPSRIAARAPPSAAEPVRGPSGDERGGVLGLVPRTGIAHGGDLLHLQLNQWAHAQKKCYLTASTAYRRTVLIAFSRWGARSFQAFDL